MEHTPNISTAALAGITSNRLNIWRHRGSEPAPQPGADWARYSPVHALLLSLVAGFIDEHACPPAQAADIVERAVPELLRQWHRLPSGLAVVLVARPSGEEHPRYGLEVRVTPPPVAVRVGTDVAAVFSVNATKALREIQDRAEAAGIALPPIADRGAWCRALR